MPSPGEIPKLYRQHRAHLRADDDNTQLFIDSIFGIGLLLGGGWPGAAAAFSILAEDRFPEREMPLTRMSEP